MADIKFLEHPTLKVPYETLNRKFRNAQKAIDREIAGVNIVNNTLQKSMNESSAEQVDELITNVVEKLKILKRKAKENIDEEQEAAMVCKRRLSHLQNYATLPTYSQAMWKKKRLDRMLVEYCLRLGYYETAKQLAQHSDIKELTNLDIFIQFEKIEEALHEHSTDPCLSWCHDNKTKLRKNQSTLEMRLRQQDFIELIKAGEKMEAVIYARKHLVGLDNNQALQQMMALLALNPSTQISPYKELFSENRWTTLVEDFRRENFNLHQASGTSVFLVTLQCGLSALKTPHCYKSDAKNPNCPVCISNLNEIAKTLPSSHCAHTKLICPVAGCLLNEHNPPLSLPNGHVYGSEALKKIALQNDGKVICPRTNQVFMIDEADKVFIL